MVAIYQQILEKKDCLKTLRFLSNLLTDTMSNQISIFFFTLDAVPHHAGVYLPATVKGCAGIGALFTSTPKPKNFQDYSSHRIFSRMHGVLNKNKN